MNFHVLMMLIINSMLNNVAWGGVQSLHWTLSSPVQCILLRAPGI